MIFKNQNLLLIALLSSVATLALCFYLFSAPVKYTVITHSKYTLAALDSGIQDDTSLFFESVEDSLVETLRVLKGGNADVVMPTLPGLFLIELFVFSIVFRYSSLAGRISPHSLWQKTTTSL